VTQLSRRQLLGGLVFGALAVPLATEAQPPPRPVIGYLSTSIPPPATGLTELGAPVLPVPCTPAALRDIVRRALGGP
jgi:hypothetical protein